MHKYLQRALFFEKFEFQTKLSKDEVLEKIRPFTYGLYDDYTARFTDDGFVIAQKPYSHYHILRRHNSFAPVLKATVSEDNGITTVSGVLRMNLLVQWFLYLIYIPSIIILLTCPISLLIWGIVYLGFFCPAFKLRDRIKDLLNEDDSVLI